MNTLLPDQIAFLKKLAHRLKPVVQIGKLGLTDPVVTTVNEALEGRELIKVKFVGFKEERFAIADACVGKTGSSLVGIIGNIAIIYRPRKDPAKRKIKLPPTA
jgi:RNA-binding protein